MNQFLVQAALKEAHRILEEERVIALSERDAERVFTLLENPPAPNVNATSKKRSHQSVRLIGVNQGFLVHRVSVAFSKIPNQVDLSRPNYLL